MRYEAIPEPGSDDVEELLSQGDLEELRLVALSISLHSDADDIEQFVGCMLDRP